MTFTGKDTSRSLIISLSIAIQIVILTALCSAQGPTFEHISHFDAFGQSGHVDGDRLYVLTNDRLHIYSLANPESPVELGSHPVADPLTVFAEGNHAYVVTFFEMQILNVTNPSNITQVGTYTPTLMELYVFSGYAYILNGNVDIVDVYVPSVPNKVATYPMNGADGIYIDETSSVAYVIDNDGFHILDVANPLSIDELGYIGTEGNPTCVWASENAAFVGNVTGSWPNEQFTIQAFDVSDPEHPFELDRTAAEAGHIEDIQALGGNVFATIGGSSGTNTYEYKEGTITPGPKYTGYDCVDIEFYSEDLCTLYIYSYCDNEGWDLFEYIDPDCACGDPVILTMTVSPLIAKNDGCTTVPAPGTHEVPAESEQELTAIPNPAKKWNFEKWTWQASGEQTTTTILMDANKEAIANFIKPVIRLGGGTEPDVLCSDDPTRRINVLQFSLCVEEDDFSVTSIQLKATGTGNDQTEIKTVKLFKSGALIDSTNYKADNGFVTFGLNLTIQKGQCIPFTLEYTFINDIVTEDVIKSYGVETRISWVEAEAINYEHEERLPVTPITGGPIQFAPVMIAVRELGFATIREAVDAADENDMIIVCSGEYVENVDLTKSLTIVSVEDKLKTTVKAENPNKHVFHVRKNDTTIEGFTIQDATGQSKAGIYVFGSTVDNCTIKENRIKNNYYGILLESTTNSLIESNESGYLGVGNTKDGIHLKGGCRDNTLEKNDFSSNQGSGVVITENSSSNTVKENGSIDHNQEFGVLISSNSDSNSVIKNSIRENTTGVAVKDGSENNIIEDNSFIEENTEYGILITGNANSNSISQNTIMQNKTGIAVMDSSGQNVIEKNSFIEENAEYGILISGHSNANVIRNNGIKKNDKDGIRLDNCAQNSIIPDAEVDNRIEENEENGISIVNCEAEEGKENIVRENRIQLERGERHISRKV